MPTKEEILRQLEESEIEFVRFLYVDNDAHIRGYVATREAVATDLEGGHQFGIVMPWFGSLDTVMPEGRFGCTGEISAVPDLETFRILPYVPQTAMLICDFKDKADHTPISSCPRSLLKKIVASMPYEASCSFENEFYLLSRDESGRPVPFDDSICFGTSAMNASHPVMIEMIRGLQEQGLVLEKYYPEYGAGQYEVVFKHRDALGAADEQIIFRETARGVAQNHGLTASFMPKPFQESAGSGCHFHISLWEDGRNLFYDQEGEYGLSQAARHFIGGVLAHLGALCAITTPTVNSYKRLMPHHWAAAFCCYGPDNREAAIKNVEGFKGKEADTVHLEFRPIDGTCNPYLATTAILAAGLDGIENKTDPGQALTIDPSDLSQAEREEKGILRLPECLGEAIGELKKDEFFKTALGEVMYEEYIKLRLFSWRDYLQQVTDWEMEKYLYTF